MSARRVSNERLLEIAVNFAAQLGLIDSPGGHEWCSLMTNHGGPDAFWGALHGALARALANTSSAGCTLRELRELSEYWECQR